MDIFCFDNFLLWYKGAIVCNVTLSWSIKFDSMYCDWNFKINVTVQNHEMDSIDVVVSFFFFLFNCEQIVKMKSK